MIDLILLCLGTASLSCFLDMCFEEGMILHWYYDLISKLHDKNIWLFKLLGGCVYCFGTWIYITFSGIVWIKWGFSLEFVGFILGIGINYFFIKAFEKYVV